MTEDDEVASVLNQVIGLGGPTVHAAELGAAVSQHVSERPIHRREPPDPETVAALRSFATEPAISPLYVAVDVAELWDRLGEPAIWEFLGRLKDLFGGNP